MTAEAAADLRFRSFVFKQDQYRAADALADATLAALADYDAQARHWGEGDPRVFATLKTRADDAEARRHTAALRLLREFEETVRLFGCP